MAKQKNKKDRLSEKQEKFCQYYLDTDGNASEALRMAYDVSNSKSESIWSMASRMLDNVKVMSRIEEIRAERAANSVTDRKKVEKVLMDIVTADINDLYISDPKTGRIKFKTPSQLPKRIRNALKKIKNDKGVVEYEFSGKVEAARLLGSWNGWDAPKDLNINSTGGIVGELRIGFDDNDD